MVIDTDKLTANWKTTAQALIGSVIAVIVAVMTLPKGASHAVVALAVLRTLLGLIQKDAQ
ncbi:hypothetical protein GCM10011507_35030 [Edaphobacter acidisoli]|uniref:Uncharacterized protein n=1 Tax=Edaphobacter acidisoli TaxID=2040573 RepID=A0A916S4B9_9BACT|nr:hypothetical protein [Edaphobacter acidisoli]GGA80813.1 hypothetical protein GCM10011507_35030 [Edaphobacter acidisoli]